MLNVLAIFEVARGFSAPAAINGIPPSSLAGYDASKGERLPFCNGEGYSYWTWKRNDEEYKVNYLDIGGDDPSKPALLLVHGFGASAYHFRHNIPALAEHYHVYAFDLLGFGMTEKPLEDYSAEIWRDQALDFIEQVIKKPVVIAGNSLGGFTSLYASAHSTDRNEDLIKGCILLNGAGRFRDPNSSDETDNKNIIVEKIQEFVKRLVINASFIYTKQPARIEQVLRQVYPISDVNVDDELVESIRIPSLDPNAAEGECCSPCSQHS